VKYRIHWGKQLKIAALLLISAVVLWRLWRGLSWTEMRHSFAQANSLLLVSAIGVSSATNLLRSFRWRVLLSPSGWVGIHDVFAATNIGIGGSFLFGNAVGELLRPVVLPLLSPQVRRTTAFLTIIVERVFDLSVLCMLFGLSLLWFPSIGSQTFRIVHLNILGAVLLALPGLAVVTLVYLRRKFINRPVRETGERRVSSGRLRRAAAHFLQQLMRGLSILTSTRELVVVTLWTAVQWLSVVFTNWLVLRAFGLPFGVKETVLVMCFGLAGSFVPTPGGAAGAFHAALSGGLILLGVDLEKAAAISIAAHLVGFIPALVFGSYYLLRCGLDLTQLQREVAAVGETR
jgi:uncharacterized protein (TIRG00374 family)